MTRDARSTALVSARGLGKHFKLYARPIDRVLEWCSAGSVVRHEPFWALRGVDLDITPGECVGIIGRNGSGKSTLLKLMSGALVATEGIVRTHARVHALLELGTGFNKQLTGRQNIAFAGSMLGIDRAYIKEREDQIVAFADLGGFIDQPVRLYSSGMTSRLAFSLFAFLDPDVLMIDEVLSVGDEAFRARCFELIERRIARGRSVVYVSHALRTMVRLCDRVLWLESGRPARLGPPTEVVNAFVAHHRTGAHAGERAQRRDPRAGSEPRAGAWIHADRTEKAPEPPGSGALWTPDEDGPSGAPALRRAWIETPLGDARDAAPAGLPFVLALELLAAQALSIELLVEDPSGEVIGGVRARIDSGDTHACVARFLSGCGLSPGAYRVRPRLLVGGSPRPIGPEEGIILPVVGVAPTPSGIVVFRKVTLTDRTGDAPDHAGE